MDQIESLPKNDAERQGVQSEVDIEHAPVANDPRKWSAVKKTTVLLLISSASMSVGIVAAIQNPAVKAMEQDLPATSDQFSLSLSLFVLVQGFMPIAWTSLGEIKGRKIVYLLALALSTVAAIAIALSPSIGLVIGFRCVQAMGSCAFLAVGAATLADIYEPHKRGTKMGLYYTAPLLGPSLGPILGGGLTSGFGWRSIFWFCAIIGGICFAAFLLLFNDTFRKERSLTYQAIVKQRQQKQTSENFELQSKSGHDFADANGDISPTPEIKITFRDVNPLKPIYLILRRWNNLAMLFATGIVLAWQLTIVYTIARTLTSRYNYDAWKVGFTSLAYGVGALFGSVIGGRLSDRMLRRTMAENGGLIHPEVRLKSTMLSMFFFPAFVIAGGWVTQAHAHIVAVIVILFGGGFFSVHLIRYFSMMYSSMLAYIVDANVGRSSGAVAASTFFRGILAFTSLETAVPMQEHLGDGWMYTIWGFIVSLSGILCIWTTYKGAEWRQRAEDRENKQAN
ncbi:hypothetical protein AGABI2DRAFT_72269 [Agaricus bisporus var. bisporus H97]|uniref:hypothetical protein n=1 Tax=Agaricus bisporus var. bisporus (strain H97 / ATCC MYA-4626 / FGSC 10389) TaxID=936046 RepID=UPI00029F776A|nr:hypothetical protein AGABI2DRAFT_72269 [Agaricus bisporus var. bisporus H97]EKV45484.1 hypothetical protein AGABI2DRAFT_72269 [Agaricus bisporus var. bisporus H97]